MDKKFKEVPSIERRLRAKRLVWSMTAISHIVNALNVRPGSLGYHVLYKEYDLRACDIEYLLIKNGYFLCDGCLKWFYTDTRTFFMIRADKEEICGNCLTKYENAKVGEIVNPLASNPCDFVSDQTYIKCDIEQPSLDSSIIIDKPPDDFKTLRPFDLN